jgi:hypothetical protein
MSAKKSAPPIDPGMALRIVDALESQANQTQDLELKRILLNSGCGILERVLKQRAAARAA